MAINVSLSLDYSAVQRRQSHGLRAYLKILSTSMSYIHAWMSAVWGTEFERSTRSITEYFLIPPFADSYRPSCYYGEHISTTLHLFALG